MIWKNHDAHEYSAVVACGLLLPFRLCTNIMTSSNGNIFRVTGPLCGEFTGPGDFPAQTPVTRSFDVFFDLRLNKRLSKQPEGWWFETPSWSLWRHCNVHVPSVFSFMRYFDGSLQKCVSNGVTSVSHSAINLISGDRYLVVWQAMRLQILLYKSPVVLYGLDKYLHTSRMPLVCDLSCTR